MSFIPNNDRNNDALRCPFSGKYHPVDAYLLHSYLYYNLDSPIISDHQFDNLCRWMFDHYSELVQDGHTYMSLVDEDALSAGTGHHLQFKFPEDIRAVGDVITYGPSC